MVKPCELYDDMTAGTLEGSFIRVKGTAMSLGHRFPANDEMAPITSEADEHSEWIQVKECDAAPTIIIDINAITVEIVSVDVISFRFKALASPLELCYENSSGYSLIFRFKYPPKLERVVDKDEREREIFSNRISIKEFGHNMGFKICVSSLEVNGILLHAIHDKLKKFAVIKIDALENATPIVSREGVAKLDEKLDPLIQSLEKPRIRKFGLFCAKSINND